ncbi:MAG: 1,2-phenylacetyl-CoA epoxidase subunit PaaE [Saprospiraceae bacterium]
MKFYPLKVKDIRKETTDCVSVSFEVPETLANIFTFIQGQYLTFKINLEGEDIRRSYSICTAPEDQDLRVAIKQVEEGKFSTFANQQLKVNDIVEVMPPMGNFYTTINAANEKNYVFFAAGSGITPIISIIKTVLKNEPKSSCTLLYGNQKVSTIIFKEDIESLKNMYLGRLQLFHILSREHNESELFNGRLEKEKIALILEKIPPLLEAHEFFACGPEEMIMAMKDILSEKGISEDHIHFELFNAPKQKVKKEVIQQAVESHATIKLDGLTLYIPVEKGQNILEAAQLFGTDVPYACKGGVCCTCRAKLIEGEVNMMVNYALTKTELENGFILTCQAIPKSKNVIIDFDIK